MASEMQSLLVHNCASNYELESYLHERYEVECKFNFTFAAQHYEDLLRAARWPPPDAMIALASGRSEEQGSTKVGNPRFRRMLESAGFQPVFADYRSLYPSLPVGQVPATSGHKPRISFTTRIAYILGLLARHPHPQVVVFSHEFDVHWPMLELMRRRPDARVAVAYFGSMLDTRWSKAGLGKDDYPIRFFDLDPVSKDLIGVDLCESVAAQHDDSDDIISRL